MAEATGYDGLSTRLIPEAALRGFLLDCFTITGDELYLARADQVADLPAGPPFAAFCTWTPVRGHFALAFDLGIEGRLAARVGRQEFAEQLAARFDTAVLYGETEPPGLWSLILPSGSRLLVALSDDADSYRLETASDPIPALPDVSVDESLRQYL